MAASGSQHIPNHSWEQSLFTWSFFKSLFVCFLMFLSSICFRRECANFGSSVISVVLRPSDWCRLINCLNETFLLFCHDCCEWTAPHGAARPASADAAATSVFTCSQSVNDLYAAMFRSCGQTAITEMHFIWSDLCSVLFIGSFCTCTFYLAGASVRHCMKHTRHNGEFWL